MPVSSTSAEDFADPSAPVAVLAAENAVLRAQVGRAQSILDSAIDHAIITLDGDGLITGWNAGAESILGYVEAEILGRSGEIVFTSEDRANNRFATEMRRAFEAGSANNERWHVRRDGTRFWASGTMLPLLDEDGQPHGFLNIMRDQTAVQADMERQALLMAEMNHRIKNTFTVVQAVAAQTRRHSPASGDFQTAFEARLASLARSHDVLIRSDWEDTPLRELIVSALSAYDEGAGRITIEGSSVMLPACRAVMVSLAFHELATNAVKHGALSVAQGRVQVTWTSTPVGPGPKRVDIVWREQDGPLVQPPVRRGFGSQLLEKGMSSLGTVRLDFKPEGLECAIRLPLGAGS